MGKIILTILSIMIVFTAFGFTSEREIVAKVGDTEITGEDLNEAIDHYIPRGGFHSKGLEKRERYRKEALKDLIERELLYKEAKARGIDITEDFVNKVVEENIKRLGSKNRLDETLRKRGISLEEFKERIRKYEAVNILLKKIEGESGYTEEEIKAYYEKNRAKYKRPESIHLLHILIKLEPTAREEEIKDKERLALSLMERLKKGEDFIEMAYKYSEDAYRVKGGDLGFIHKGQLNPDELEEAAFSLKSGEVAGPIRTIYGFHLLKAIERRPEETLSFDAVKERLSRELREKRFEERKKDLISRLRKEYTVQIFIDIDGGDL